MCTADFQRKLLTKVEIVGLDVRSSPMALVGGGGRGRGVVAVGGGGYHDPGGSADRGKVGVVDCPGGGLTIVFP